MGTPRIRCAQIRTKNPTAKPLKGRIFVPGRSIVRLGSQTPTQQAFPKSYGVWPIKEINTVDSVLNSRDKLRMKTCFKGFAGSEIPQAQWWEIADLQEKNYKNLPYPLVAKRVVGFKGHGMFLVNNEQELRDNLPIIRQGRFLEHFHNFAREYRLHCTQDECFMAWRKLRKENSKERWFFNSLNCNWVSPAHELFDRPSDWDRVVASSIAAMKAVGLDIGAVDVRIQSNKHKEPAYIICEVNSAPALGDQGAAMYERTIKKLLTKR